MFMSFGLRPGLLKATQPFALGALNSTNKLYTNRVITTVKHFSVSNHLNNARIPDFEGKPSEPGVNSPRLDKIVRRLPKFLKPYTSAFVKAPGSHLTAFLILHELSAIVPLFGFWWIFHNYPYLMPLDLPSTVISKGVEVIERSLANYDLFQYNIADKSKYIVEGAYAYGLVKALFPLRVMFSIGLMPLFAKYCILPWTRILGRVFGSKKTKDSVQDNLDNIERKKIDKPRL